MPTGQFTLLPSVAAEVFTPKMIPGLVAWYDFTDITSLFQDTLRATPCTADGQAIGSVTDKSGLGLHLARGGGAGTEPTLKLNVYNGRSAARLDGGDYLRSAAVGPYAQPNTVYCVANNAGSASHAWYYDGVPGEDRESLVGIDGGVYKLFAGTTLVSTSVNNPEAAIAVWTCLYNGASSVAYHNGTSVMAASNPGPAAISGFTVGASTSSNEFLTGDMMMVLAYNGLHTSAQINSVGRLLAAMAGQPWTPVA